MSTCSPYSPCPGCPPQRSSFALAKGALQTKGDVIRSYTMSSAPLTFRDRLAGRRVYIVIVAADGKLQSPKELRARIMRPLEFIKRQKWVFHRRQQALLPLGCVVAECSPCGRVRLMLPCVAFACQRLATAPAHTHMARMSWSWAEVVMERVTRGRVRRVQVRLQRRACCAVRCACRANACVR
jgi:hypothetical protein